MGGGCGGFCRHDGSSRGDKGTIPGSWNVAGEKGHRHIDSRPRVVDAGRTRRRQQSAGVAHFVFNDLNMPRCVSGDIPGVFWAH